MNKYSLKQYPQDKYKFRVFDNVDGLDPDLIVKQTGCLDLINLGYFALKDVPSQGVKAFSHQCAIMVAGKWVCAPQWDYPGICISKDAYAKQGGIKDAEYDYVACAQADYIDGVKVNTMKWAKNGVTYTGIKKDGTIVAIMSVKDEGLTSEEAVSVLLDEECVTILRWDGSWSSRGRINEEYLIPSQWRKCRSYLLIYPRTTPKPPKPEKLYKVQVGAFAVKANAEKLRDELAKLGYKGFIQEV